MDPHRYCEETVAELLARRARPGSDPEVLERLVVLAHFFKRAVTAAEFEGELLRLAADERGRVGVAAAARAILRDWQSRAAVTGR